MYLNSFRVLCLASLTLFGCEEGSPGGQTPRIPPDEGISNDIGIPHDSGITDPDAGPGQFESVLANLRFKRSERLKQEFMRALDLAEEVLCNELGAYNCFDMVHGISLGGVEPYGANINVPFETTSISAPMAIERIALSACTVRIELDQANGANAVLFDMLNADTPTLDPRDEASRAALTRLFRRTLVRNPTADELSGLAELYDEIAASNHSETPAFDWARLSCFSVLTSAESLFY